MMRSHRLGPADERTSGATSPLALWVTLCALVSCDLGDARLGAGPELTSLADQADSPPRRHYTIGSEPFFPIGIWHFPARVSLANPSAEVDGNGDGWPDGYSTFVRGNTTADIAWDSVPGSGGSSGSRSIRLGVTSVTSGEGLVAAYAFADDVVPGELYTFRARIKSAGLSAPAQLGIRWRYRDASGSWLWNDAVDPKYVAATSLDSGGEWEPVAVSMRAPTSNAEQIALFLAHRAESGAVGGSAWFDDLMLFSTTSDADAWSELAQAGFNTAPVSIASADIARLDLAQSHGLKLWLRAGNWIARQDRNALVRTRLANKVNEIRNHPALFGYDTIDEPYWNFQRKGESAVGYNRDNLTAGRDYVNSLDALHPVTCTFAPYDLVGNTSGMSPAGYAAWTSVADTFALDRYPVESPAPFPNQDLSPVGAQADFLDQVVRDGAQTDANTPRAMILQGCGIGDWAYPNNQNRRPTFEELRFMTYSSIVHGANGIFYYGQYYVERSSQMWGDIKRMAGELSRLEELLTTGSDQTGFSVGDSRIEATRIVGPDEQILIAANASPQTLSQVPIWPGWNSSQTRVLFEGRTIDGSSGFRDDFGPWEVHIYLLEALDRRYPLAIQLRCADGTVPTSPEPATTFWAEWPPSPLSWHIGDAFSVSTELTVVNDHELANLYVGVQSEPGVILEPLGAPPHPAMEALQVFNPPTWMVRWQAVAVSAGPYVLRYRAPDSWCP